MLSRRTCQKGASKNRPSDFGELGDMNIEVNSCGGRGRAEEEEGEEEEEEEEGNSALW